MTVCVKLLLLTVADDHASLQWFVSEGLVADPTRTLVDIEEAADTVTRPVEVVQTRVPQGGPGEGVQEVAWWREGGGGDNNSTTEGHSEKNHQQSVRMKFFSVPRC